MIDSKAFEQWIKKYATGRKMETFPVDFKPTKEVIYKINGLHYRIKFADIPKEFQK